MRANTFPYLPSRLPGVLEHYILWWISPHTPSGWPLSPGYREVGMWIRFILRFRIPVTQRWEYHQARHCAGWRSCPDCRHCWRWRKRGIGQGHSLGFGVLGLLSLCLGGMLASGWACHWGQRWRAHQWRRPSRTIWTRRAVRAGRWWRGCRWRWSQHHATSEKMGFMMLVDKDCIIPGMTRHMWESGRYIGLRSQSCRTGLGAGRPGDWRVLELLLLQYLHMGSPLFSFASNRRRPKRRPYRASHQETFRRPTVHNIDEPPKKIELK